MRTNTIKSKVLEFVAANPGLKRKQYVAHFIANFGMTENSASLYHYQYVTKAAKQVKIVVKGPVRDPKTGRYMKKVA